MSLIPNWLRRIFCTHHAYLEDMKSWTDLDGNRHVTIRCNRCGHSMSADYGLLLPVVWQRRATGTGTGAQGKEAVK